MGNQFSEDLFRSIDTIVSARMSQLPYDQTMIGYISDISQRNEGIYKAKYESLEVMAYSENTEYELGDQVYISVPRADYSQKKIILGRIPQDKQEIVKVRPFENYVPCTPNFNTINKEISIIANSSTTSKEIFTHTFAPDKSYHKYSGYDSLGLKLNLSVNLENNNYKAVSGNYYVQVIIKAFDQSKVKDSADLIIAQNRVEQTTYTLSLEDMASISYYNSYGYCSQEKVFDIKNKVIREITVKLCQDKDFKTKDEALIPEEQKMLIACKDVEVTFGYAGRHSDFANGKLFIYTPDGLLYNSNEDSSKQFYSRVVIYTDGNIYEYNPPNSYINLRWYKYDPNESDYIDILETSSYRWLEEITEYSPTITFPKGANAQNQKFRMAISKETGDWLKSEALTLTNNINLTNSEIIDSITGFQVNTIGDNDGIFNIYGQDNLLLNEAESFRTHYLRLSYTATASNRSLRPGDIIKWKFPNDKTMIKPLLNNNGDPITEIVLTAADLDDNFTYQLPFKIKNLYNPTFTQNTIQCELTLVEDTGVNTVLTYNKELLFGTSGSSGNDYILTLELCKKGSEEKISAIFNTDTESVCANNYQIIPHLYNYAMNEITNFTNQISYSWLNRDDLFDSTEFAFQYIDDIPIGARILKATIADLGITSYLPIATRYSGAHSYIEGCRTITYDITGKKPIYYKFQTKLNTSAIYTNMDWKLYYYNNGSMAETNTVSFLPILDNNDVIIPPSIYSSEINNIFLICNVDGENAWVQPILITKNKYPSAMFNAELNQSQIGDWLIEQTMVGQVDGANGLVFGHVKKDIEKYGLLGLNDGEEFFSLFMTDGSVYIKDGQGRIQQATELWNKTSNKLYSVGSETIPVYFKNGIPVAVPKVVAADYATTGTIATAISSLNNTINNLNSTISSLTEQLNNLKNKVTALESKVNNL